MPRLWIIVLCCLVATACDKKTPAPPVVDAPPAVETINGSERIGWEQPAADAVELATISYALYVDGARTLVAGVTCGSTRTAAGFSCTGPLPSMTPGAHAIELASFVNDGGVHESARSAQLHVLFAAQTALPAGPSTPSSLRSGLAARQSIAADGLDSLVDLAFTPDGRIILAERAGRIRIVRNGVLSAQPAIVLDELGDRGQLQAVAVDPQFERTHYVFAIYTAPSRTGDLRFTLARFREVSGTLGDRAVLLDGIAAASANPHAVLRFGPDGRLYAAFDDGGDPMRRQDAGSMNGKVLRLNADGTTPADAAGGTPIVASGIGSPAAIDWDPATVTLWVADHSANEAPFVFYRGALFPAWSGRMVTAATLFDAAAAAGVTVVVNGPDGALYYGTARALGRLAPDRAP